MSSLLQILAQLDVVENLTIVDNPERLILIADGLPSVAQINDAQPRTPQRSDRIEQNSKLIGATMPDSPQHPTQLKFTRGFLASEVENPSDATHQASSFRAIFPDSVLGSDVLNSTYFGTIKSSRCERQCANTTAAVTIGLSTTTNALTA